MEYTGERVEYNYDGHGNIKTVTMPGTRRWEYIYNVAGQKQSVYIVHANARETRAHDGLGRVRIIEHRNLGTNEILFRIEYLLGVDGQRLGWTEYYGTEVTRWRYKYDELGRLARERRDDGNNGSFEQDVSYTYDPDSNRESMEDHRDHDAGRTYEYAADSQRMLKAWSYYTNPAYRVLREEYEWTANGEQKRVRYHDDAGNLTRTDDYTWGPDGTMRSVTIDYVSNTFHQDAIVYYTYDHNNELVGRRVVDGGGAVIEHERYLVDHLNPTGYSQRLATFNVKPDGSLALASTFAWSADFLAQRDIAWNGTTDKLPQTDALGTVRNLTYGQSGSYDNSEAYRYSAFGSLQSGNRSLTDYAFTGQVADSATNLQYHRARWLDVAIGQWKSADSVFDYPNNHGSHYHYVANNPIMYVDQSGSSMAELLVVAVIIAKLAALFAFFSFAIEFTYSRFEGRSLSDSFKRGLHAALIGALFAVPVVNIFLGAYLIGKLLSAAFHGELTSQDYWKVATYIFVFALIHKAMPTPEFPLRGSPKAPKENIRVVEVDPANIQVIPPTAQLPPPANPPTIPIPANSGGSAPGVVNPGARVARIFYSVPTRYNTQGAGVSYGGAIIDLPMRMGTANAELLGNFTGLRGADPITVLERIPSDWLISSTKRDDGVIFRDPINPDSNWIRIMPGKENTKYLHSTGPYLRVHLRGSYKDNSGNSVDSFGASGHIPLKGNPALSNPVQDSGVQ